MKTFRQFVLPELMGFLCAAAATGLSLLLFVWGGSLFSGGVSLPIGLSLSLMMTLSTFLLYASIPFCGKLAGDVKDVSDKLSFSFTALFLLGAALAAAFFMIIAMSVDVETVAALVMLCYMIVCDMVVVVAFTLILFILGRLLRFTGKDVGFLSPLKWRLLLFLLWSAFIYGCLLFF